MYYLVAVGCCHSLLVSPVSEVVVHHPVGEALPADADALQYAVTGQLVHHQVSVDHACTGHPGQTGHGEEGSGSDRSDVAAGSDDEALCHNTCRLFSVA